MRRAFPWLFMTFAGSFVIFLIVQIAVLLPGVRLSLADYEERQRAEFDSIARAILINPNDQVGETLRYTNPFFVFSSDGNLLFTNRGQGRAIPSEDLQPVYYDGSVIGHYYAGEMRFLDSESNRIFLSSLVILVTVSLVASVVIGILVSLFASRRIARPLLKLQSDIRSIETRDVIQSHDFSITEISDISTSLGTLSTMLGDEERYKRQWMQDIAHDLRTPVSGLRSQIEGMRDGVLEPSADRFGRNLVEIDRLEKMIEGIATLYSVENLQSLSADAFRADAFVAEILASFEVIKKQKSLRVETDIAVDTIAGDRTLLLRAVNNIVANAFAYTPADGAIRISIRAGESHVEIEVVDDGPGIPNDQLDRIFNRFYRGEFARNTSGTGLGLNIAKAIVERHGGQLHAQNREPTGASFTLTLPIDGNTTDRETTRR